MREGTGFLTAVVPQTRFSVSIPEFDYFTASPLRAHISAERMDVFHPGSRGLRGSGYCNKDLADLREVFSRGRWHGLDTIGRENF